MTLPRSGSQPAPETRLSRAAPSLHMLGSARPAPTHLYPDAAGLVTRVEGGGVPTQAGPTVAGSQRASQPTLPTGPSATAARLL